MGRYVFGVFEHGLERVDELTIGERIPSRIPSGFAAAHAELDRRWGHPAKERVVWRVRRFEESHVDADTNLVDVEIGSRLAIVRPAPRWLGFAHLADLRELCREMTWAVGVALDRRSPVLFLPDSVVRDEPPETFEELVARAQSHGPSADPFWASEYVHLFRRPAGEWLLDSLDDFDEDAPLVGYRSMIDAFHARGGMRLTREDGRYAQEMRWPEILPTDGEVRVHVRAAGVEEDAPEWWGLLTADVDGTEFTQFRDIYSGNTLGDDPIAAAIDYACTRVDPAVMIHLTGIDVRSAEIVVTEAQVRRLAQVGARLDVTVSLRSSD